MNKDDLNTGNRGECLANEFLRNKGYDILDTNFFFKTETGKKIGEIDIIAKIRGVYVFIEVKTTTNNSLVGDYFCLEKRVNKNKVNKIILTANSWFITKNMNMSSLKWQIDVIGVIINNEENDLRILHFENVFEDKKF
ncbi:MAG: YraN family protein [Candidatus Paceibacterota bacterium]|jgi:putative endonuclease|nr:YraN family protein [bacterium]